MYTHGSRRAKKLIPVYTMAEIPQDDCGLLGAVPQGADSVNLRPETVQLLEDKGYIPGPLESILFYDAGVKDTNWSFESYS